MLGMHEEHMIAGNFGKLAYERWRHALGANNK